MKEDRRARANPGKVTVSEWIDRWLATQDVGPSTVDTREYLIRRFIRPAWAGYELGSLSSEEITAWENAIPARTGVSRRVARDARSLLATILGDAAAATPPLIPANPAIRPPNRGRRTGRRLERSPQTVWATPLQALLAAERAALLTGRDEDFTMVITMAYTGLRWGEAIGLERDFVHGDEIHVEWQLREIRSTFHRLPPKNDSYRTPGWEPCLPVDLPPFLAGLLARQLADQSWQRCACAGQHGGSGHYVFPGPGGGHPRRSNYGRRVFRPACDGRYQAQSGKPPRVAIADASAWPGIPVTTWAPARPGIPFTPPRGRGIRPVPGDIPLACWLPVRYGLTPHGLRHSHKTWMAEDHIPEILAEQRLGHTVPGMRGLYAHASDRMRDDLRHALQARWEDSLRARARISPQSPVPLLGRLLAPFRDQLPGPVLTASSSSSGLRRQQLIHRDVQGHGNQQCHVNRGPLPARLHVRDRVLRQADCPGQLELGPPPPVPRTPHLRADTGIELPERFLAVIHRRLISPRQRPVPGPAAASPPGRPWPAGRESAGPSPQ